MENRVNVFVGFKIETESIYTHFWNVLLDFLLVFFLLDFLFFLSAAFSFIFIQNYFARK